MKCLFEDYQNIPESIKGIVEKYLKRYAEGTMDYKDTAEFCHKLEEKGYTFDCYLDNEPYGLRPISVELEELEGFED